MIKLSIRNKIMGIAVTLIALMVVTAIWTVVLVMQVGTRIEEFAYSFVPAYGDLARANIRSLEQGITIRRIIIDRLQSRGRQRPANRAAQPLRLIWRAGRA